MIALQIENIELEAILRAHSPEEGAWWALTDVGLGLRLVAIFRTRAQDGSVAGCCDVSAGVPIRNQAT